MVLGTGHKARGTYPGLAGGREAPPTIWGAETHPSLIRELCQLSATERYVHRRQSFPTRSALGAESLQRDLRERLGAVDTGLGLLPNVLALLYQLNN